MGGRGEGHYCLKDGFFIYSGSSARRTARSSRDQGAHEDSQRRRRRWLRARYNVLDWAKSATRPRRAPACRRTCRSRRRRTRRATAPTLGASRQSTTSRKLTLDFGPDDSCDVAEPVWRKYADGANEGQGRATRAQRQHRVRLAVSAGGGAARVRRRGAAGLEGEKAGGVVPRTYSDLGAALRRRPPAPCAVRNRVVSLSRRSVRSIVCCLAVLRVRAGCAVRRCCPSLRMSHARALIGELGLSSRVARGTRLRTADPGIGTSTSTRSRGCVHRVPAEPM